MAKSNQTKGWLNKYDVPQAQEGIEIDNLTQEVIDAIQSIYRNNGPSTMLGRLPFNLGAAIGVVQSRANNQPVNLSDKIGLIPNPYAQVASYVILAAEKEKKNLQKYGNNKYRGKDLTELTPKKEFNNTEIDNTFVPKPKIGKLKTTKQTKEVKEKEEKEVKQIPYKKSNQYNNIEIDNTYTSKPRINDKVKTESKLKSFNAIGTPLTKFATPLNNINTDSFVIPEEFNNTEIDNTKTIKPKNFFKKENGGIIENYNDSNAFASPDMVGDGLSNVGRNSSPAWGGQFQNGGNADAMRGMMKSKIGMGNAFEHPAIKRMSQAMPKTGMTPEGLGTHYMSSMGEYAVPLLQDTGKDQLEYFENPKPSREDIRFNSPEEAEYFGEHYKEVAPMSTIYSGLQEYQMGGSIPGAVGFTYARTKGIPSEGKYAKKTLPSAQNGKEMQYYQNGLDFQPKTISKNGTWLSKYEQAQNGYQTGDKVTYGTPEYEEAYNKGEVVTEDGQRSPIALDEVVIQNNYKRPRGFWEQYRDKIVDENKDAGLFGAIIGTPVSAITSLPQLATTYALTDKVQRPSEAMDIQNPYGAMAVDAVFDPSNAVGVGELAALSKLSKEGALTKLGKIPTSIAPELRQGLRTAGPSFNSSELFDLNKVRKPSGSIGNQGATSEGANNILQSLGIKVKGANPNEISLKEMVEHLKNNPKDAAKFKNFLEKEPINVTELPGGEYHINDGHHRATLSYYSGNENIPAIIKNKGEYTKQKDGGIIKDDRGQWDHPGEITEIGSNQITMQGVPYDVLGISDEGDVKLMKPGKDYKFKGKKVTEFPMAKNGVRQEQKGLQNLEDLTNFTNYNKPTNWLNKYN